MKMRLMGMALLALGVTAGPVQASTPLPRTIECVSERYYMLWGGTMAPYGSVDPHGTNRTGNFTRTQNQSALDACTATDGGRSVPVAVEPLDAGYESGGSWTTAALGNTRLYGTTALALQYGGESRHVVLQWVADTEFGSGPVHVWGDGLRGVGTIRLRPSFGGVTGSAFFDADMALTLALS